MSRSSGPGSPSWFKCAASRSVTLDLHKARGHKHVVTRTGRTKPRSKGAAAGVRHGHVMWEYRCSCGHHGWSAHNDIDSPKYPIVKPPTWAERVAAMSDDDLLAEHACDDHDEEIDAELRRRLANARAPAR